ncbi:hypothetical protein EHM69_09480 [candidate division KSB1 bacterium]|nr:MAG: hypothetical protein EHM69_09480 [candidate division KSB1 bacterium]
MTAVPVSTALGMLPLPLGPKLLYLVIALPLTVLFLGMMRQWSRKLTDWRGTFPIFSISVVFFVFLALHFHYFPQGVDDSFITLRYSENFAAGRGICFNPGERIEGFSNPLWMFGLSGFAALGVNLYMSDWALYLVAKLIGVLCHLAVFLMIVRWAMRGRSTWWALLVGLSWLVAAGANTLWAVSGMETSLHSLLLLWAVLSWNDLRGSGSLPAHPAALTTAILLLALSRPEGAMFGVVLLVFWAIADRRAQNRLSRRWIAACSLFVLLSAAMSVFRLAYFGTLLPNTFYAKATGDFLFQFRQGLQYLGTALVATGGWIWLFALWQDRRDILQNGLPFIFVLAQVVFILKVGGDWMLAWRFWAPMIPLGVVGLIIFLNRHAETVERVVFAPVSRWRQPAVVCGLLFLTALQTFAFDRFVFFQNDFFISGFRRLDLFPSIAHYEAGLAVGGMVEPGAVVAVGEAGLIPYIGRARALDCHGLFDRELAALPGRMHEKTSGDDILRRNPEYILLGIIVTDGTAQSIVGWDRYVNDLLQSREFASRYNDIWRNSKFVLYRRRDLMHGDLQANLPNPRLNCSAARQCALSGLEIRYPFFRENLCDL